VQGIHERHDAILVANELETPVAPVAFVAATKKTRLVPSLPSYSGKLTVRRQFGRRPYLTIDSFRHVALPRVCLLYFTPHFQIYQNISVDIL
jgi:hypothetical protein